MHHIDITSMTTYEVQKSMDRIVENQESLRIVRDSYISIDDKENLKIINSKIKDCLTFENKLIQGLKKI